MSDKNKIVLDRLKKLIDTATREEIAKGLECDTSTVTKHYNNDRPVTLDYTVKYAKYFGVSTDYLLGLTNAKTSVNSAEGRLVRSICDYTGLSEDSVKFLNGIVKSVSNLNEKVKKYNSPFFDSEMRISQTQISLINDILNSNDFHFALRNLSEYIVDSKKYVDELSVILSQETPNDELFIKELYLKNIKLKYYEAVDNLQDMVANICEPILCESTGLNIDISARRIKESIIDMVISLDEKECEANADHNKEE